MTLHGQTGRSLFPFGKDRPPARGPGKRRGSKLFFALKPPRGVALRLRDATALHALGRTKRLAYPAELLHVTLLCMNEYLAPPYELVPGIRAAMATIRARPVSLTLDRSGIFGSGRHLALTNAMANHELGTFVRLLHTALSRHNLPRFPLKPFTPHVTVVYDCGPIEPLPVEEPYDWIAGEFLLIYSHNGESRHEEFGRWNFDPDAPPYSPQPQQLRFPI